MTARLRQNQVKKLEMFFRRYVFSEPTTRCESTNTLRACTRCLAIVLQAAKYAIKATDTKVRYTNTSQKLTSGGWKRYALSFSRLFCRQYY